MTEHQSPVVAAGTRGIGGCLRVPASTQGLGQPIQASLVTALARGVPGALRGPWPCRRQAAIETEARAHRASPARMTARVAAVRAITGP
jgi:hypothetical protein